MRKRELLTAAIVKDYRFTNPDELDNYLNELESKKIPHRVEETYMTQTGQVLARISVGYNNSPLIEIYES